MPMSQLTIKKFCAINGAILSLRLFYDQTSRISSAVEQLIRNQQVAGSIPVSGSKNGM
jgi:hypothetical protein